MRAQTLDPFQIQYFTVLRALHFRIEWGVLGMCTVGQFRLPRLPWWCEESLSYVEHSPGMPLCLLSEPPRHWSQTGPWNVCAHVGNSGMDLLQALRLALPGFLLVSNRGWVLGMLVWLGKGVQALLRLDHRDRLRVEWSFPLLEGQRLIISAVLPGVIASQVGRCVWTIYTKQCSAIVMLREIKRCPHG